MRIVVDLNRCLGYAQRVPPAPKTIKLAGEEALEYNPNPDDAQRQQVLRAEASCPSGGAESFAVAWRPIVGLVRLTRRRLSACGDNIAARRSGYCNLSNPRG
jgi:hypothetical protein